MVKFYLYNYQWVNNLVPLVCLLLLLLQVEMEAAADGDLGSIVCVDGKWKIDTRLMALIMTCPLPLDGSADSVMKLAKCAMNKLGLYDGQYLSNDFVETACSLFPPNLKGNCTSNASVCAFVTQARSNWRILWPLFAACFLPWVMSICNI